MSRDFARSPHPTSLPLDDSASEVTHIEPEKPQPTRRESVHDEQDVVNLPFRTLSNDADLNEYTEETMDGHIARIRTDTTGKIERYELVTWKTDDPENPKNWSKAKKWWCTMVVALTCFVGMSPLSRVHMRNICMKLSKPNWNCKVPSSLFSYSIISNSTH